jgi:hypothetical protein
MVGPLVALSILLPACAGDYVSRTQGIRRAYETYDYARALDLLQKEAKGSQIDRLLVLLDRGMILHSAGRFDESIAVLAEADRLSQQLDGTSISEEAKALLSNERERAYRGEDFEKLMITVLQALNYAELGNDEDALVEVRRVNERIHKMIAEEKKPYQQLAIARYLGGILYEDQGDWDNAFIDYQEAQKLQPNLGALAEPLLRLAKKTQREDAYRGLKAIYPEVPEKPLGRDEGQLVVIIEAGLSPEKKSAQREHHGERGVELVDVPVYRDRWRPTVATIQVGDQVQTATTLTSLGAVAKVHLDDRIGRILAKSIASMVAKAGVAAGAAALTKSEEVGALTFLLLSLSTRADLRSWLSLPAEFQLARFRLAPGKYQVRVGPGGKARGLDVEVRPRRIALSVMRSY